MTLTYNSLKDITNIILVIVGEGNNRAQWAIHQSLLENHSKFAHAALRHSFKERDDSTIQLPEEDVDAFAEFVKFVYTGCIVNFSVGMIVRMYTLADRLQAHKFADACYETLSTSDSRYGTAHMKLIFDNTTENDRLRKLCISQVGKGIISGRYTFDTHDARDMLSEYMGELMQGVTVAVKNRSPGTTSTAPTKPAAPAASSQQANTSSCHLFADPNVSQNFSDQQRSQQHASNFGNAKTSAPPSLFDNNRGNNTLFGTRPATNNSGTGLFGNNNGSSSLFGNRPSDASSSTGLFGQQMNSDVSGGCFDGNQAYNDGFAAGAASVSRQTPFTTNSHSSMINAGVGSSNNAASAQNHGLSSNSFPNAESGGGQVRRTDAEPLSNTVTTVRGLFGNASTTSPSPFNARPTTQTQNTGGLFDARPVNKADRAGPTSSTQSRNSGGLFGARNTSTSAHNPFSFPSNEQNRSESNTQTTPPIMTTSTSRIDAAANNRTALISLEDVPVTVHGQTQRRGWQSTAASNHSTAATAAISHSRDSTSIEHPVQAELVDGSETQTSGSWESVPREDDE